MSKLQEYVERFGPEAGQSLYHIYRSRAAHKGVSTKRRLLIEELTGRRFRTRRSAEPRSESGQMVLPWVDPSSVGLEERN